MSSWDPQSLSQDIPSCPREFLKQLGGPTVMCLPGEDSSRTRVLVTLTHGHESSGFKALHLWLRSGRRPKVDIVVILGGVKAALMDPPFYYRHPPGERDLNRCFSSPYEDEPGRLAREILECIGGYDPEAVLDMHNTSAPTPPFAVIYGDDPAKQNLAGVFVDNLIISNLKLGSLMEQDLACPVITLEVGGHRDPKSQDLAVMSLERYFLKDNLLETPTDIRVFRNSLRLELAPGRSLGFSDSPLPDLAVTIRNDIDSLNFFSIDTGQLLGWASDLNHLRIRGTDDGNAGRYFTLRRGGLYPKAPMTLFMASMRSDIAASDCVFYFSSKI
ncbi:MAG: hypothetical protein OXB88_03110 [Bacteriovoracales bacterium]|nr:hypothetical protein [Bacteriovoracales bacterium]